MKTTALTYLILSINALIDSGEYDDVTIGEVHEAVERRGALQLLKERARWKIDLIWRRINQAPVPVGQLEHRRSHSLAFVRHHAEPASRG